MTTTTPRVWIGCLAAYNEGHLHGEWVDADDLGEMSRTVSKVLSSSPATHAEEIFLADNEGFFGTIGEYTPLDEVAEIAQAIEEHGEAYAKFVEHHGGREHASVEQFEEAYRGQFDSEEQFAEQFADDIGLFYISAPYGPTIDVSNETLGMYFDYERFARDLFCGDFFSVEASELGGGIHVFDGNV